MQGVYDLLGASHGKGRNDDLAVLIKGFANQPADVVVRIGLGRMFPVSVGAFHLKEIDILDHLRVAQDFVPAAPDVSTEQVAEPAVPFADVEDDLCGTQDVAGVPERHGHAVGNRKGAVVVQSDKLADGLFGILLRIERFNGRLPEFGSFAGDKLGVRALDLRGILEHDAGQIACGEGAVNVPGEPLAAEIGQVAAVINVRVAQNHRVDAFGLERQSTVSFQGVRPASLIKAAFQKKPLPVDFEQVH